MPKFLPRFPNLTTFECSTLITNAHIELLASACSKLQTLILDGCIPCRLTEKSVLADVSDAGLFAIAKVCRDLRSVSLSSRKRIGDVGVIRLVHGLENLTCLDMTGCRGVTDQSLGFLGKAGRLRSLNLEDCTMITDNGLISLASGALLNTLKKLVLRYCDLITDRGVTALRLMSSLEELNLAFCWSITDVGGEAISSISSLEILDLSCSDIGDATLELLAGNCKALEELVITGCGDVTGYGIRCFASHKSLRHLVLTSCFGFSSEDVEYLISSCQSLRCIKLDWRQSSFMSMELEDGDSSLCCIDWN